MKEERRSRVVFIDLARALAIVLMVIGHTSSALLAQDYRVGPWIEVWEFQRGLTSGLFLLLAGFAFSIATTRHWAAHVRPSAAVWRRLRRFALFIVLGYGLHFPVRHVADLATATERQWRAFVAVDVLQLIGVTLIVLQLFVMAARTRRAFMLGAFAAAAAVVAATPAVWRVEWTTPLPLALAAYMSPEVGSLFPLFPWTSYVLIGAGLGQLFTWWGTARLETFAVRGMLAPGITLILAGASAPAAVPAIFAVRAGACFVILAVIAFASLRISQLPHVFGAVAQESLVVYFVHLCVVYGSIWNRGLYQYYGEALTPAGTLVAAAGVLAPMIVLAWTWNRLKHARPRAARWTAAAALVFLAVRLL